MSPVLNSILTQGSESFEGGATPLSDRRSTSQTLKEYERELTQFLKTYKTNLNHQWKSWDDFYTYYSNLNFLYKKGESFEQAGFSFSSIIQFEQLRLLYQQFAFYASHQEIQHSLSHFVSYFKIKRHLSWNELHTYQVTYRPLMEFLTSIKHHWVCEFGDLCFQFIQLYQQLPNHLDWASYDSLISALSAPSSYLSERDLSNYALDVENVLKEGRRLLPFMPFKLQQKCKQLKEGLLELQKNRNDYNREILTELLHETDEFLSDIDGKSLDYQQRLAVLSDEDQTVVLAGAGSGKTLTIAAKVEYLVQEMGVDPSEILLISFTNKAAGEMEHRIKKALDIPVDVKTFHKLGLDLIGRYSSKKPSVACDKELAQLIESYLLEELFVDPNWSKRLIEHFPRYLGLDEKGVSQPTLREYYEFKLLQKLKQFSLDSFEDIESLALKLSDGKRTLQHEYVKSMEEMKIANFLFLNGIRYEYEANYPYNTADETHRQYRPDFFLPDYQIYLEHFGVTEKGIARWLPKEKATDYEQGIEWKRAIHQHYQTKMIETYSYQEKNDMLLKSLRSQLEHEGVPFQHIDVFTLLKRLMTVEKAEFTHFVHLIETFISFFKGNLYTLETLNEWRTEATDARTICFFEIVKPILERYEANLQAKGVVDFNDMIARSIDIAKNCDPSFLGYRYVIIDEYQDISYARFQLIQAICEKCEAKLLCVGDDWQSIYRFAGSDLELFHRTAKDSQILRLEQTYRNSQALIDLAGAFVMKNPKQYQKSLLAKGTQQELLPVQIYQYGRSGQCVGLKQALRDIASSYGDHETIFLLGRYTRDIQCLDEGFDVVEDGEGEFRICFEEFPNLKIHFLTVHKSKGMECDHVIVLNLKDAKLGFPSQLEDDPLLERLMVKKEAFPYAEERRLFYVALTRAKKTCRLLVPIKNPSCFATELTSEFKTPVVWRQPYSKNPSFKLFKP